MVNLLSQNEESIEVVIGAELYYRIGVCGDGSDCGGSDSGVKVVSNEVIMVMVVVSVVKIRW